MNIVYQHQIKNRKKKKKRKETDYMTQAESQKTGAILLVMTGFK